MMVEFKVKNYRSYKDEVIFSMEAESSKLKANNIFEFQLGTNEKIRTLKTSLIYGANNSGKTNLIRALFDIVYLLNNVPKVGQRIWIHNPFAFDIDSLDKPGEYELTFIGPGSLKYIYKIVVKGNEILEESLDYWPKSRVTNLFKRAAYNLDSEVQTGIYIDSNNKKKEIQIFSNQLLLSKFAEYPDEMLTSVWKHLKSYNVINAHSTRQLQDTKVEIDDLLFENDDLRRKVGALLKAVDTKIEGIKLELKKTEEREEKSARFKINRYYIYALHKVFKSGIETDSYFNLPLEQESKGTNTLYVLGAKILNTIAEGGVLIMDELDTSLHPFITKLLVMLFQSEKINTKRAQLIFTTHDTTLLDSDLIRKDQVWFVEKNENGSSDLYSLQDFEKLREDTPFEKWYIAGKFGAIPNIDSIEKIYENVTEA